MKMNAYLNDHVLKTISTQNVKTKFIRKIWMVALSVCISQFVFFTAPCQQNTIAAKPPAAHTFLDSLSFDTFRFFWENAEPTNGNQPDRWPAKSFSSIAATGFGLSAYIVGVEKGYVTRAQAADRVLTTLKFFASVPVGASPSGVAGYKGFFYHFIDMKTGHRFQTVELSTVDTGWLIAGMLSCQSYFDANSETEKSIRALADQLYRSVEWDWAMDGHPEMSMGYHPENGFIKARWDGYNEALLLYVMAIASPTHPLPASTWKAWTNTYQWAKYQNFDHVNFGPLFGHQYSHMFIDFKGIQDEYMRSKGIDYFENSRRATLANRAACIANSGGYIGYGPNIWGLSACDGPGNDDKINPNVHFDGYTARGAAQFYYEDDGTIAPTAAGGSIPFAPEECIAALKAMKKLPVQVYDQYGFKDAFNQSIDYGGGKVGWVDPDHLGLDQGPILIMLENYRSQIIWKCDEEKSLHHRWFEEGWVYRWVVERKTLKINFIWIAKRIAILIVGLLLHANVFAQVTVQANDTIWERNLMPYELPVLVDTTGKLTFSEISSPESARRFKIYPEYQNTDFITGASYWIRVSVRVPSSSRRQWLMEFYDQTIDNLDIYTPGSDGTYKIESTGDHRIFEDRLFQHKNFEILVDGPPDEIRQYYFRVQSHEFADLRIAFRSVNRFVFYTLNEYFLYGTFYGMVLIISLYNFLVYLAIREIKNIYYIFYILSVALYALSLDGIGFQYLWRSYPEWNDIATGVGLFSLIFWSIVFTRRFLSTRANVPKLDRTLLYMLLARSAFFFYALFFNQRLFEYRYLEIIPISLIFYTGVTVWYRGYKPARFFVIAYGSLFGGFLVRTLVYFNVFIFTTVLHYSLHISFVFEMLFLTFALGDRIRILKDNRDRALRKIITQHELNMKLKDKVNQELEEKVAERTEELNVKNHELESINAKLGEQAQEINRINSTLDLDNWKLKGKIKEVLNDQILEKTMEYVQFRELYPDALTCYRFLEDLKWSAGFVCKKCANDKYFAGAQKFSRRCTRCGYNESITAFTIFHSIKFPIEKAFYIAFQVVAGKKGITLDALSSQLSIRLSTVWNFRHKVLERITELEKRGKRPTVSRWEEVILAIPPQQARDGVIKIAEQSA